MVFQELKVFHSRMGQCFSTESNSPLHFAALGKSLPLVQELIQLHPPALRQRNGYGESPLDFVFDNHSSAAPAILRAFLQADPGLVGIRTRDTLPIHRCVQSRSNPNVLELVSILLEADPQQVQEASKRRLPIHLAARAGPVEVLRALYECGHKLGKVPELISVVFHAVDFENLAGVRFLHGLEPGLLLRRDRRGRTPLYCAATNAEGEPDCGFVQEIYAMEPSAITAVGALFLSM